MTTNQKFIVIVILGILLFSLYIRKQVFEKSKKDIQDKEHVIDSLKTVISQDSLKLIKIEQTILNMQISIDSLNQELAQNEVQIKTLKTKRNEKIAVVSKYSHDDIIEFLTKRYNADSAQSK